MISEIINLFFQAPLFVQVLILSLIVLIFVALIIVIVFHERVGIESIWVIKFTPKETKIKAEFAKARELPGQYFIGIDIGRRKIDYCLMDYNGFVTRGYAATKVVEDQIPTPHPFRSIYGQLVDVVQSLFQRAPEIDGIGLGLPGQVDPRKGLLLKSPGFDVNMEPVIKEFSDLLKQRLNKELPIEIDNDARCATRYLWKRRSLDNVICIFVGNGLGSGIVLGGRMLYGYNFTAGEIGHTTISETCKLVGKKKCQCGVEGCHWEMYVSSGGMMNIAKNLNPGKYKTLKTNYEAIKRGEAYKRLLKNEEFSKYSEIHFDKNKKELTPYFLSLAFYAGEEYASEVVKEFIKYLAIGIANYINVLNPETVYLGGGMIRAFYDDEYESPYLRRPTAVVLREEIDNRALSCASQVAIFKRDYTETRIASMGAALMFKDESFFEYKNSGKREANESNRHK